MSFTEAVKKAESPGNTTLSAIQQILEAGPRTPTTNYADLVTAQETSPTGGRYV